MQRKKKIIVTKEVSGRSVLWLFLALGSATILAFLSGEWAIGVALYLAAGIAWVTHDRRRPDPGQMPLAYRSLWGYAILLIWPARAAVSASERWAMIRSPERYDVGSSRWPEGKSFGRWADALAFARQRAAEMNEKVMILDSARYRRGKLTREYHNVMYSIEPSGEIEEIEW